MNIYKKILGVFSVIIIVAFLIVVYYLYDSNRLELTEAAFFILPSYVIIHYLLLTKFGFKLTQKYSKLCTFNTLILFTIVVLIPTFFIYQEEQQLKENEKQRKVEKLKNRQKEEALKKPITFYYTTVYNIDCELKIRYNYKLEYILNAKYLESNEPKIQQFTVYFFDSAGFYIDKYKIDNLSNIIDEGVRVGYYGVGNVSFSRDDYEYIHEARVAVNTE